MPPDQNPASDRHYLCQRCGNCCRWPGWVRLTENDITALAGFLGLSEFDFVQRYTELRPDRRGLVLKEQPGGACIFLEGANRCRVNPVKPAQCRGFPNTWNFPGWEKNCDAIPLPAKRTVAFDSRR